MHPAVVLTNTVLAGFFLLLCLTNESETSSCDTKWIRLVYMLSCGKKKRESIFDRNETFSEPLPTDIHGAIKYFRERDPTNPLFRDNEKLLNEILDEDEYQFRREKAKYGRLSKYNARHSKKFGEKSFAKQSVLMKKILASSGHHNYNGIPGFPDHWDITDLMEQKINENHRREIDRLIEECCKTSEESTCNGDTFRGACR